MVARIPSAAASRAPLVAVSSEPPMRSSSSEAPRAGLRAPTMGLSPTPRPPHPRAPPQGGRGGVEQNPGPEAGGGGEGLAGLEEGGAVQRAGGPADGGDE